MLHFLFNLNLNHQIYIAKNDQTICNDPNLDRESYRPGKAGVVHAAGVLSDGTITKQSRRKYEEVQT